MRRLISATYVRASGGRNADSSYVVRNLTAHRQRLTRITAAQASSYVHGVMLTRRNTELISRKTIKRIAVIVLGGTVLLLGIALLVLPGPAFIVIPLGLAMLAAEFAWARRWLRKARDLLPKEEDNLGNLAFVARHTRNFIDWASVRPDDTTRGKKKQHETPKQEHQPSLASAEHRNQEQVLRRAYELFQARGGEPHRQLQDWLKADEEVNNVVSSVEPRIVHR